MAGSLPEPEAPASANLAVGYPIVSCLHLPWKQITGTHRIMGLLQCAETPEPVLMIMEQMLLTLEPSLVPGLLHRHVRSELRSHDCVTRCLDTEQFLQPLLMVVLKS